MKVALVLCTICLVLLVGLLVYGICKTRSDQTIWEEVQPDPEIALSMEDAEDLEEMWEEGE